MLIIVVVKDLLLTSEATLSSLMTLILHSPIVSPELRDFNGISKLPLMYS